MFDAYPQLKLNNPTRNCHKGHNNSTKHFRPRIHVCLLVCESRVGVFATLRVCTALVLFALVGKLSFTFRFATIRFAFVLFALFWAARIWWKEFICSSAFIRANCLHFLVASIVLKSPSKPWEGLHDALQVSKLRDYLTATLYLILII